MRGSDDLSKQSPCSNPPPDPALVGLVLRTEAFFKILLFARDLCPIDQHDEDGKSDEMPSISREHPNPEEEHGHRKVNRISCFCVDSRRDDGASGPVGIGMRTPANESSNRERTQDEACSKEECAGDRGSR